MVVATLYSPKSTVMYGDGPTIVNRSLRVVDEVASLLRMVRPSSVCF